MWKIVCSFEDFQESYSHHGPVEHVLPPAETVQPHQVEKVEVGRVGLLAHPGDTAVDTVNAERDVQNSAVPVVQR